MTKGQQFALGLQRSTDNGSLTLVGVLGWAAYEFWGIQLPPGISELVAGYVVMIGTKIRGAL